MASIATLRAEEYGLEPAATDEVWDKFTDTPREAEIELSKAISLKRIADELAKANEPVLTEAPAGPSKREIYLDEMLVTKRREVEALEQIALAMQTR